MNSLATFVRRVIGPYFRNFTYTVAEKRLEAGLKRRGGFGFIPKIRLSPEHIFLDNYCYKHKTVYDIGGYIGQIAMFFSRSVGEAGYVYTFEPNFDNYYEIKENIRLNNLVNIIAFPIGLSNKGEVRSFIVAELYTSLGSGNPVIQKNLIKTSHGYKEIKVNLFPLDSVISEKSLRKPDFIKIDVEGYGLEVLRGMKTTIEKYHPDILIELHDVDIESIIRFFMESKYHHIQCIEKDTIIDNKNLILIEGFEHLYVKR